MYIPASVQSIGESAFKGCESLNKVTFAKDSQLKEIEKEAFAGGYDEREKTISNKLTEVQIPASV